MKKIVQVLLVLWGLALVVSCSTSTPSTPKPFGAGVSGATTPTPTTGSGGGSGSTFSSPTPIYLNNYGTSSGPNAIWVGNNASSNPVSVWVADGSVTQGGDVTMFELYTLAGGALTGGTNGNQIELGVPTPGLDPPWTGSLVTMKNPIGLAQTDGWYATLDAPQGASSGGATLYECGTDSGDPGASYPAGWLDAFETVCPTYSNSYGGLPLGAPKGVAGDNLGNFYVPDAGNGAVYEFGTGCFFCINQPNPPGWEHFWTGSSTAFPFRQPTGIACDPNNNVWVSDVGYTPSEIEEYASNGGTTFIIAFSTMAGCVASSIAVDNNDDVYVADTGNGLVEEYSPTGQLMRYFNAVHSLHTYLPFKPTCIGLAYTTAPPITLTNILVGDYNNNLIDVFGP
jgi:hypothetical protein